MSSKKAQTMVHIHGDATTFEQPHFPRWLPTWVIWLTHRIGHACHNNVSNTWHHMHLLNCTYSTSTIRHQTSLRSYNAYITVLRSSSGSNGRWCHDAIPNLIKAHSLARLWGDKTYRWVTLTHTIVLPLIHTLMTTLLWAGQRVYHPLF